MPPPRRTMKRLFLRTAAFSLAGALTALLIALLGPILLVNQEYHTPTGVPIARHASLLYSATTIASFDETEADAASLIDGIRGQVQQANFEPLLMRMYGSGPPAPRTYHLYEAGWPTPMLTGWLLEEVGFAAQPRRMRSWVVRVPTLHEDPWTGRVWISLPLRPHWPGLAINTATFGTEWWALFALAGLTRRTLRRRRGRCASCAYPRAGLAADAPCPECGRLPTRRASTTAPAV